MRPLHRTQPDEAATLAMENDLLRLEVVHVRARLLAAEAEVRRLEKAAAKGAPAPTTAEVVPDDEALTDLRWLLRRIEATPLKRVLQRRHGYQRLVGTYLDEDHG